jgi:hypothetical protein
MNNVNYEKINKLLPGSGEADLPAIILGSLLNWQNENRILFLLYLKRGITTNNAQDIFKSLACLLDEPDAFHILQELGHFVPVVVHNDSNLSEREQKVNYLNRLDGSVSARLYGLSFLLGQSQKANAGQKEANAGRMLGTCEQMITEITTRDPVGILRYYTYNEIISLFMERIDQFAKICTRLKLFNAETKYVYTLFLNMFKKEMLRLNK